MSGDDLPLKMTAVVVCTVMSIWFFSAMLKDIRSRRRRLDYDRGFSYAIKVLSESQPGERGAAIDGLLDEIDNIGDLSPRSDGIYDGIEAFENYTVEEV